MTSILLRSPAKLNLTLSVINKRPDGYHNLSTLFEKINLVDDIGLSGNNTGLIRVFCDHPDVPLGPRNLVHKVAVMLRQRFHIKQGVDIRITKNIPVAAGLAGGSSNAATTILGLNRIWNLHLSEHQMVALGQEIGCDVPLFIYNYTFCHGTQRGDHIKKVYLTSKIWHILIVPRVKVYSREVFRAFKMKLTKKSDNVNILIQLLRKNDVVKAREHLSNHLERAILSVHPSLLKTKKHIEKIIGKPVIFSGSGPSLFSLAVSGGEAKQMCEQLKKIYKQVFAVSTYDVEKNGSQ